MASQRWTDSIDLTLDSSDDENPPLRPQKASRLLTSAIDNLRRPALATQSSPQGYTTAANGARPLVTSARPPSTASAGATSGSDKRKVKTNDTGTTSPDFVPLYSSRNASHGSDPTQPEKRRKLSTNGNQALANGHQATKYSATSAITNRSEKTPSQAKAGSNLGMKLAAMNGVPTIHTLQNALKSSSAGLDIPSQVLEEKTKRLQIRRTIQTSNDDGDSDVEEVMVQNSTNSAPDDPLSSAKERKLKASAFTTDEDHLLLFLKEIRMARWAEIATHFTSRTWSTLQTHYSQKLKRRNRSQDPRVLQVPSEYVAEAAVGWAALHGSSAFSASVAETPLRRVSPAQSAAPGAHAKNWIAPADSGNESAPQRGPSRPRRAVQTVDYTLPKQRVGRVVGELGNEYDDAVFAGSPELSEPSTEPSVGVPDVVLPVEAPLVVYGSDDVDVLSKKKPYLSYAQRSLVRDGPENGEWDQVGSRTWQGSVVHVDFTQNEFELVEQAVEKVLGCAARSGSRRKWLRRCLENLTEPKLLRLAYEISRRLRLQRDRESIAAFIEDAKSGRLASSPRIERIATARPAGTFSNCKASVSSLVRQREFGLQSRRGWKTATTPLSYQLKNKVYDTLGPAYSYTGASGDIHTVAWSPDGENFAAGAVCVTDPDSMQYNRRNNLLYGDVHHKRIRELGEHYTIRVKPDSGPNSTDDMHVSQDRNLYHTVTAVAFSQRSEYMFTAGYDKCVNVWRTAEVVDGEKLVQPQHLKSLAHKAEVDLLAVSCHDKVATASRRWQKSIKVCTVKEDNVFADTYSSPKADTRPDLKILPTALQFEPKYGRLLLAGFGANKSEERLDINGDICLWDIETRQELGVHGSMKNVFDVCWRPNQVETSIFAAGCVAGSNVNRGTRSIIRLYDGRGYGKRTMVIEAECPALDMNDVVFCPYDDQLVAAGCTSGQTYIWDLRRPDDFLYRLSHGKSLMPLDDYQDREVTDTGVRFLSWGANASRLYTGSSDGVVKVWDVARSVDDVFIKDLVTCDSGIMSGSFNHDKTRLLVGEVNGSINVLEVGREDFSIKNTERLKYEPYDKSFDDDEFSQSTTGATDPLPSVSDLLATGEMMIVPFGGLPIRQAVQGPNYAGPFDTGADAHSLREQALEFQAGLASSLSYALESQCTISGCGDAPRITAEEIGDSGRSLDRIPDELRKMWASGDEAGAHHNNAAVGAVMGRAKCANCGRPARPSTTAPRDDGKGNTQTVMLCERCNFSCFRCNGVCRIDAKTQRLVCTTCFRVWDIGVLGYECVEDTGYGYGRRDKDKRRNREASAGSDGDGDELNALTDWFLDRGVA